jgi:hypothetical protein
LGLVSQQWEPPSGGLFNLPCGAFSFFSFFILSSQSNPFLTVFFFYVNLDLARLIFPFLSGRIAQKFSSPLGLS